MAEHMNTEQEKQSVVENPSVTEDSKKQSISYLKLWEDVKKRKRLYYKVLPVTFILAAIYSLSLPNYYDCSVVLAPELNSNRSSSSLTSLMSSFGVNLNSSAGMTNDAIRPDLYPELMNSVTFRASLFDIKVHRLKEDTMMTYYDYLLNGQKSTWWADGMKAIFSIFSSKKVKKDPPAVNTFKLTKKQTLVAKMISKKVVCDVDKKTYVITIQVTDQDPLIAALIADSVQQRLQDFITTYRTRKARVDVEYYRALEVQSKKRYEKAVADYAWFSDHNQHVFLESVRSQQSKLENEVSIQQRAYQQIASQLQVSEAKLQEEKPAFTTLQPATVPLKKTGPSRAKMCLVFLFLAFIGTTIYILYKEGDLMALISGGDDE